MPSITSDDDLPVEGRLGMLLFVSNAALLEQEEKECVVNPPSKEGIKFCSSDDVLCGRGGGTNVHPGNRRFRDLVNASRRAYLKARKNDKPAISRSIVSAIREMNGRFLKKDEKSGLWHEIGDDGAREKTSQALRRRQRARQQQQMMMMQQGMPGMGGPGGMQAGPGGQQGMPGMGGPGGMQAGPGGLGGNAMGNRLCTPSPTPLHVGSSSLCCVNAD